MSKNGSAPEPGKTARTLRDCRIAVACCGLGHVYRGIEVWAAGLARSLHARGVGVTLFKGGGQAAESYEVVVPCLARTRALNRWLTRWRFPGLWRTPLGSPYALESYTFTRRLIPRLGDRFDIVHVQDQLVAKRLHEAGRQGRIRAKLILANGTEEGVDFLGQFDYVQELDPHGVRGLREAGFRKPGLYSVPNFVDAAVFRPGDRGAARRKFGLPEDAYIVLTVGAIEKQFKRTDFLIREFGEFLKQDTGKGLLVIAGARTPESQGLADMAKALLGDRFRILENVDHRRMPELYRAADLFVFCVTHGIYGIALAEAAATGLPCVVHDWERVKWVAGPEATVIDMRQPGQLSAAIGKLTDRGLRCGMAGRTRAWAERALAENVIVEQYINMYESVLNL